MFKAGRDACDGVDVPDASARAFRDASGAVALFGMHYRNRAFRGPGLDALKLDCAVVLESGGKADPAAYDDASWITATWTEDGRTVAALVHHEYRANEHPGPLPRQGLHGRAGTTAWWRPPRRTADAASPAPSPAGGRGRRRPSARRSARASHRGFFNPSNIVADGTLALLPRLHHGLDAAGQRPGRRRLPVPHATTPPIPTQLARLDRHAASRRPSRIPTRSPCKAPATCAPVAPFPTPVGAVVRHRGSGAWIAVFMAKAGAGFPQSGFYWTTSRDLLAWDQPRLLLAGATLYDDPCQAPGGLIAYPSLLDPDAQGRNFDDTGDTAILTYVTLRTEGCTITSDRDLLRRHSWRSRFGREPGLRPPHEVDEGLQRRGDLAPAGVVQEQPGEARAPIGHQADEPAGRQVVGDAVLEDQAEAEARQGRLARSSPDR